MKHLFLLVALTACEVSSGTLEDQTAFIIGGEKAMVGDFPTTVSILIGDVSSCTGTLISHNIVLTAAHCVAYEKPVQDMMTIGFDLENTRDQEKGRIVEIEKIVLHEDWDPEKPQESAGDNDIALIWLKEDLIDRLPTPINRFADDVPLGTKVTHAGYGLSVDFEDFNRETADEEMMFGILYSIKQETVNCEAVGIRFPNVNADENLLCFRQDDGDGTCLGDSGGPAYIRVGDVTRVAGVTSFTTDLNGSSSCRLASASTRVDAELDFLFEHAPELQCQADGVCNDICAREGLPTDDDCSLAEEDNINKPTQEPNGSSVLSGGIGGCSSISSPGVSFGLLALAFIGFRKRKRVCQSKLENNFLPDYTSESHP